MHKAVIGLAAAAALTATTFAPVPAKADPISAWWLVPAILGGIVVGSTFHHRHAHAAPRAEYYGPPRAYYAQPRAQVYYGEPRAQYHEPRARVRARY